MMNTALVSVRPPTLTYRLESVDFLRGIVMILMALDHVRHFFSSSLSFHATNLSQTDAALFLTRWITHFCAPAFFFLAGAGIFLSAMRGKTKAELARFLVLRGLWLVFLELTVIHCCGWAFNFDYHYLLGGVIWALGWSMIALAPLVYLSPRAVAAFGITMIHRSQSIRLGSTAYVGITWLALESSPQHRSASTVSRSRFQGGIPTHSMDWSDGGRLWIRRAATPGSKRPT